MAIGLAMMFAGCADGGESNEGDAGIDPVRPSDAGRDNRFDAATPPDAGAPTSFDGEVRDELDANAEVDPDDASMGPIDSGREVADAASDRPDATTWVADDSTYVQYLDANEQYDRALCICEEAEDIEACVADEALATEAEQTCRTRVWPDHMGTTLGPSIACRAAAWQSRATCLSAAARCDTRTCTSLYTPTVIRCPRATTADQDAFEEAALDCIVGTPSTCPAVSSGSALGASVFTGSTLGQGDDFGSCGGEGSPDVAFRWTAPMAGSFTISTLGSPIDTVLSVFTACSSTDAIECNDDTGDPRVPDEESMTSRIVIELTAGQEIIIVVDGYDEYTAGDFQVAISITTG